MTESPVELRADCTQCFALCCVALPFTRSADFAVDKAAGEPCGHLQDDFGCGVHGKLRDVGFRGCTSFDCFGAGQRVSQETFGGRDWRAHPETAGAMFQTLPVMRALHELLWYLADIEERPETASLHAEARALHREIGETAQKDADSLATVDLDGLRGSIGPFLTRASEMVRGSVGGRLKSRQHLQLMGANLSGARLSGVSFRGSLLIAADLRKADLRYADLLGADLRDADLSEADLTGAVFVTQSQINSARGSAGTALPARVERPAHW
ncbi:pentapeptide repeat-containing protein [Actinomadura flavalba]|uniref:pentapeptide repeat-containing protein n=1 Tax=Actinomadura flavalba TaxID=1120938 RepID=UPI00052694C0|nr:pentapeptide repeat-containing protein [Actinomadura flavalba]